MLRTLAIAGALLGLASAAQADVWRWTDPNGTIHYSDSWVPGSVLVKTDTRTTYSNSNSNAAVPPASGNATTSSAPPVDPVKAAIDKRTVEADKAKSQADQCKQAREAYDSAIQHRRLFKEGKNGEREYLSEPDADALRMKLLNARKTACGT
jgi:hypothetical protein